MNIINKVLGFISTKEKNVSELRSVWGKRWVEVLDITVRGDLSEKVSFE